MSKFIAKQSVILSDYESHRSLSFQFYERGVVVKSRQDQVNNKDRGADPRHFSSLIVSHLKNDEAIKLRDRLLAQYPVECSAAEKSIGKQSQVLDKFECIHCGGVYVRHQLRTTFCDNCDRMLEIRKVEVNHE